MRNVLNRSTPYKSKLIGNLEENMFKRVRARKVYSDTVISVISVIRRL